LLLLTRLLFLFLCLLWFWSYDLNLGLRLYVSWTCLQWLICFLKLFVWILFSLLVINISIRWHIYVINLETFANFLGIFGIVCAKLLILRLLTMFGFLILFRLAFDRHKVADKACLHQFLGLICILFSLALGSSFLWKTCVNRLLCYI
jgi:hypothetical protein